MASTLISVPWADAATMSNRVPRHMVRWVVQARLSGPNTRCSQRHDCRQAGSAREGSACPTGPAEADGRCSGQCPYGRGPTYGRSWNGPPQQLPPGSMEWVSEKGSNRTRAPCRTGMSSTRDTWPPHRSWHWHLAAEQVAGSSLGQVPRILWMNSETMSRRLPCLIALPARWRLSTVTDRHIRACG